MKRVMLGLRVGLMVGLMISLTGCAQNKNVKTITEASKSTIEQFVKQNPECKGMSEICTSQIDTVNKICQQEIKIERNNAWNNGFMSGAAAVLVLLMVLAIVIRKAVK